MKKLKLISLVMGLTMVLSSHSLAMQHNQNSNNNSQNPQFEQNNNLKRQLDKYVNENNRGNNELEISGLYIHPNDLKNREDIIWLPTLQATLSVKPDIFVFGKETYIYKLIYYISEFLNGRRNDEIIAQVKVPLSYLKIPENVGTFTTQEVLSFKTSKFAGEEESAVYVLLEYIKYLIYAQKNNQNIIINKKDMNMLFKIKNECEKIRSIKNDFKKYIRIENPNILGKKNEYEIIRSIKNDLKRYMRIKKPTILRNNLKNKLRKVYNNLKTLQSNPYVPLTEQYNEGIYQDIHNNSFDSEIKINPNANQNNNMYDNLDYSMMNPIFRIFQNNYDDNQNNYDNDDEFNNTIIPDGDVFEINENDGNNENEENTNENINNITIRKGNYIKTNKLPKK